MSQDETTRTGEPRALVALAELVQASKGFMGCQQPTEVYEGEWAPCAACWGCRLEAAVQEAEKALVDPGPFSVDLEHVGWMSSGIFTRGRETTDARAVYRIRSQRSLDASA